MSVDDARRVIEAAIEARIFPAASVEVGAVDRLLWSEPFGHLTFAAADAPAASHHTIYDLASLTKPIATTTMVMELIRTGALTLEALIADRFDEWRGTDREAVTVRDVLEHASGLAARLVDAPPQTRREFAHEICTMPLEYEPRTRSIYSDLGFILLGFLAADLGSAPLNEMFERITVRLKADTTEDPSADSGSVRLQPDHHTGLDLLTFNLSPDLRDRAAPTRPMDEDARRGRDLVGEVHDNYAAALGGVAGHAGLFGNASGVGAFARTILRSARGDTSLPHPFAPGLTRLMTTKSTVPSSSRALGWDTMLPTSSCGTRMSPQAFGHVGFTGTSLWIDPARDRYFVLLTNRVLGGGTLDQMRTVRREFHDALGDV